MPVVKRPHVAPTDDWQQLQSLAPFPEQRSYKLLRPVVLFGRPPDAPTEAEWARLVGQAAGWDGAIVALPRDRLPEALVPRFDTAQPLVTDTSRIRHELGYAEPVPRDEALRRTVAWRRAHPSADVDPAAFDDVAEDSAFGRTARGGAA